MVRATRFRQVVQQQHLAVYEMFSVRFRRAARELAQLDDDPQLASIVVSRRSFDRWMHGDIKGMPRPSTCRVLEHLLGEQVEKLFDSSAAIPPTARSRATHGSGLSAVALLIEADTQVDCVSGKSPFLAAMESFRRADRQLGGGHVYRSVLHYLQNTVAPALFGAERHRGGDDVFRAAIVLTEMCGWMAHDVGRDDLAREHFKNAFRLGRTVTDPSVSANILGAMSHLAFQEGRTDDAVRFARAGLEDVLPTASVPMLSSRLYAMEARALARLGDATGTRRALEAARSELDHVPGEFTPEWVAPFDSAALASEMASALFDLGMLPSAAKEAERAVALRGGDRARSRVFGQICLARILIGQQEVEAACDVAGTLLTACESLSSVRITQQLRELKETLLPYSRVRPVKDLLAHMSDVHAHRKLILAGLTSAPGAESEIP